MLKGGRVLKRVIFGKCLVGEHKGGREPHEGWLKLNVTV